MSALDELLAQLEKASPDEVAALEVMADEINGGDKPWYPTEGKQMDAFHCEADILFYGGEAGGGKTDLLLGIASSQAYVSTIFRQQLTDVKRMLDRLEQINPGASTNRSPPPSVNIPLAEESRKVYFQYVNEHKGIDSQQGQDSEFMGFDEAPTLPKELVLSMMTWNRTAREGGRARVVLTGNPPKKPEEEWVIDEFAPWLDPQHENPAKEGELRWYARHPHDDKVIELPVGAYDGSGEYYFQGCEDPAYPQSRTFIRAGVEDNPYLDEKYKRNLSMQTGRMGRSMRDGIFERTEESDDMQVFPTAWVNAAMDRWEATPKPHDLPMRAVGVDMAGGGKDKMVVSVNYGDWFGELVINDSQDVLYGGQQSAVVMTHRRNEAPIMVDMGGGFGGSLRDTLRENGISIKEYNGAKASNRKTADKTLEFHNLRAEAHWRLREALDPENESRKICLPPSRSLKQDLCAIRYEIGSTGIKIEPKKDAMKRIGRSPDEGDAVILSEFCSPWTGTEYKKRHRPEGAKGKLKVTHHRKPKKR